MITKIIKLVLFVFLLNISFVSSKSIVYEKVDDLNFFKSKVLTETLPKDDVLVIFDIDDTLLEATRFVGSNKWYAWQRGKKNVFDDKDNPLSIKDQEKFNCIGGTLGTLFDLGDTKKTQEDADKILFDLQQYNLMILTSRSIGFRGPTDRDLKKSNFNLAKSHLMANNLGLSYVFDDGNRASDVTYQHGIVMSSGLNKGLVLQDLLGKLNKSYKSIYFVDDSSKNIIQMQQAWEKSETKVSIFHYTKVDKRISPEEIKESNAAKIEFDQFLQAAYPERAKKFTSAICD